MSTIQCPKCNKPNAASTISSINKNTGLKTKKSSLFWGLVMFVSGAFFIVLSITNWDLQEFNPFLILGVGSLLFITGIPMIRTYILRKEVSYYHYHCKSCSYKWNQLGREGDLHTIKHFIDSLENDDVVKKEKALNIIVNIQDSRFIEPLRKNLDSKNSEIQALALGALCSYKEEGIRLDEILNIALDQDREKQIRIIAIEALGGYKSDKAIDHLINSLDDKSFDIRAEALTSLRKVTGKKLANESSWQAWWEEKKLRNKA